MQLIKIITRGIIYKIEKKEPTIKNIVTVLLFDLASFIDNDSLTPKPRYGSIWIDEKYKITSENSEGSRNKAKTKLLKPFSKKFKY